MSSPSDPPCTVPPDVAETVARILHEDRADSPKAYAIVPATCRLQAHVVGLETAVLCGRPWFDQIFRQLDATVSVRWSANDGDHMHAGQHLCSLEGDARALLSGERAAMNFLQTLSAVASTSQRYADRIKGTRACILDTSKTLPGLRTAQRYAVRIGGCGHHCHEPFNGVAIHSGLVLATGSIEAAVANARRLYPDLPIAIEVHDLEQMQEALQIRVERVLLNDLPSHLLVRAAHLAARHRRFNLGDVCLEAGGDIDLSNVRDVADAGVDFIAVARLTQDVRATAMSMRFVS